MQTEQTRFKNPPDASSGAFGYVRPKDPARAMQVLGFTTHQGGRFVARLSGSAGFTVVSLTASVTVTSYEDVNAGELRTPAHPAAGQVTGSPTSSTAAAVPDLKEVASSTTGTLDTQPGQWITAVVQVVLPAGTAPGWMATAQLTVASGAESQAVSLTAEYIAVNPNDPIGRRYQATGVAGVLGDVAGPEMDAPDDSGRIQQFDNGYIYSAAGGGAAVVMSPAVYEKWLTLAKQTDALGHSVMQAIGPPVEDTFTVAGAQAMVFQNGAVVTGGPTPGAAVYGAMWSHYRDLGGVHQPPGALGLPIADEVAVANARLSQFERGDMFWSARTGAHEVHGAIRAHWHAQGGTASALGLPVSDELPTADGRGRYNRFENGDIVYRDPSTFTVPGPIRDRWKALHGVEGYLGYPTSDPQPWNDPAGPGTVVAFEGGHIAITTGNSVVCLPNECGFSTHLDTHDGAALSYDATLTIRADGSWTVDASAEGSGFDPYDVLLSLVVRAADGSVAVAAQGAGHVDGTGSGLNPFDPGVQRTWRWTESGTITAMTRERFAALQSGVMTASEKHIDVGLLGGIQKLAEDFVVWLIGAYVASPEVATVVLGLGAVMAEASTKLTVPVFGGLAAAGVVGGVVYLLVGGEFWPVVLAAAAAITAVAEIEANLHWGPLGQAEYNWLLGKDVQGNDRPGVTPPFNEANFPDPGDVIITNLGIHARGKVVPFTIPLLGGKIAVNLWEAYGDPTVHAFPTTRYPQPGQLFVHEMAHAWQIHSVPDLPWFICSGLADSIIDRTIDHEDLYTPPPLASLGPPNDWDDLGIEQQATVVDCWFAGCLEGRPGATQPGPSDPSSPWFPYISSKIWVRAD